MNYQFFRLNSRWSRRLLLSIGLLSLILSFSSPSFSQVTTNLSPFFPSINTVATSDGLGNSYNFGSPNQAIIPGDFDNDGDIDIVFSSKVTSKVTSFAENLGNGNFAPIPAAPALNLFFHFGLPIDLNKDGSLDVVGIDYDYDRCFYQLGNGDGTFNAPVDIINYVKGVSLDTADFNGDGFMDLVVGSSETTSGNNQMIRVYAADNTGPTLYQSIDVPGTVVSNSWDPDYNNHFETATGDYNQDGFTDIGIVKYHDNSSSNTDYYIAINNNGSGFLPMTGVSMPSAANSKPTHLKIFDYDEDGSMELVVLTSSGLYSEDGLIASFNRGVDVNILDLNNDGKQDFLVLNHGFHPHTSSSLGWVTKAVYWLKNIGNGIYQKIELLRPSGNMTYDAAYLDLDQDGYYDIVSRPKSGTGNPPNSLFWHPGDWRHTYPISGSVWYDTNLNGTFDSGETGFPNIQVTRDGSISSLTSGSGNYSFTVDTLDHTLSINTPPGWSISTDSLSYLVHFNGGFMIPNAFDFGLSPDSLFPQSSIHAYGGSSIRCDSTTTLSVSITSYGSEVSSAQMSYALDSLLTVNSLNFTPDSIVGQTIYWSVDSIWINQSSQSFSIVVNTPGASFAGTTVNNEIQGTFFDNSGTLYQTLTDQTYQTIRCSYDPNDKQVEPVGVIEGTNFIPLGQNHSYRIRFQNTGNDTAYNIRIADNLTSYLDPATIQIIDASHPYTTTVTSNLIQFHFNNINLPASSQNFDESQGFIEFTVNQHDSSHSVFNYFYNYPLGNVYVTNKANIYFDYNAPIETNNVINRLYSCDTVQFEFVPNSLNYIFPGDTLHATNYEEHINQFEWRINETLVSTDSLLVWPSWADSIGTYTVSLSTTNEICTKTSSKPIDLYPIHVITLNEQICDGDSLFAAGDYQTTTGVYYDSLTNHFGFDSIIITNLSILPIPERTMIIEACDTYTWMDGNTYTVSNDSIPYFKPNPSGCDSLIILHLTIKNSSTGTDVVTACNSFTWIDGNTYTSSNNTATDTLTNIHGCDSIVTLDLTIHYSNSGTDVITACDSFTWINGNTYTSSNNTATDTLTNIYGCDSIVTLDLTIHYSNSGTDVITACDSFTWIDGNTYTSSNNMATDTLTNIHGCDSIVTLDLTIHYSNSGTHVITACDSYTWIDGNTYTASNNTATHTLANINGCDSIVTLDLTINYSTTGTDVVTACDSYTWIDGNTYNSSNNTATHILTNSTGCDSIVTLNLTIHNSTSSSIINVTSCGDYQSPSGNQTWNSTGLYYDTLQTQYGCDSVLLINLSVQDIDKTVLNVGNTLVAMQSSAQYQWINCSDGSEIPNANDQTFSPMNAGDYAVIIDYNTCIDTSECKASTVSIDELTSDDLIVFPNPTSGEISIELSEVKANVEIKIVNSLGQVVSLQQFENTDRIDTSITGTSGVFFIHYSIDGRQGVIRIVKI